MDYRGGSDEYKNLSELAESARKLERKFGERVHRLKIQLNLIESRQKDLASSLLDLVRSKAKLKNLHTTHAGRGNLKQGDCRTGR